MRTSFKYISGSQEGYHACLCRRSDLDGLNRMVNAIKNDQRRLCVAAAEALSLDATVLIGFDPISSGYYKFKVLYNCETRYVDLIQIK